MTFTHSFNFTRGTFGWRIGALLTPPALCGRYVGGVGFQNEYCEHSQHNDMAEMEIFSPITAPFTLTRVTVVYTDPYDDPIFGQIAVQALPGGTIQGMDPIDTGTALSIDTDWNSPGVTQVIVRMNVGHFEPEQLINAFILGVTIEGEGDDPFGQIEPENEGCNECDSAAAARAGEMGIGNPIGIRHGEKREEVKDISLSSPAGELAFIRTYSQNKRDDFQFMGLGWSHNHRMKLIPISGTPNKITIILPRGGNANYAETDTDHYEGVAGVDGVVDWDSGTSQYTVTNADQSTAVFDDDGKLLSRSWPNGETWDYGYTGDDLTTVSDAYDRQLQFSYRPSGDYDAGQLWRVGDQTADDLDTSSPSGRYVEFGYTPEKSDGDTITSPSPHPYALLRSVKDVRGHTWLYDYYGQHSGQTDSDQLNFLTKYESPSVDATGDAAITLHETSYTLDGSAVTAIHQERGNASLTTDYAFQPDDENITTETRAGKVTTHHFLGGVYAGTEAPGQDGVFGYQFLDSNYRPILQVDANGSGTELEWSEDGKRLTKVTLPFGQSTSFHYNDNDTLDFSVDAQGRRTQYTYDEMDQPRLPKEIQVFDVDDTTVLLWQAFTYNSVGQTLTEQTLDPSDGETVLRQVTRTYYTSGDGNGLLHTLVQEDIGGSNDVTTTYTYDSAGRVIQTQQSSNFGGCEISFTVYDKAGNVVATICNYDPGMSDDPTDADTAEGLYDPGEPDKNQVTTYVYDEVGRRIQTTTNAGADFAVATRTVYDALSRVVRTITNYVVQGTSNPRDWEWSAAHSRWEDGADNAISFGDDNNQNLITDVAYNERGTVKSQRDVLGHVTLFGYDDADRLIKTVQNASDLDYDNDYGMDGDPSLAEYDPGEDADQDIITTQEYDFAGNLVKTVDSLGAVSYTVYDPMNRPVKTVRAAKDAATIALNPGDMSYAASNDPRSISYVPSADPDRDLIATTEYDALGRVIRTQHLLENRPSAQWDTMLYGYDPLGRQVKTIHSASDPDYDIASDPDLSEYDDSDDADQDIISKTAYDVNGRVLYTEDTLGSRTWVAYDGLGRQVKTVVNAVGTATDDGSDDPRSDSYTPSSDPDKDVFSLTTYDSNGRVESTEDALGRVSRSVYDTRGRIIRSVTNFVAQLDSESREALPQDWYWDDSNHLWKGVTKNMSGDVLETITIDHGTDNDQNIITDTLYDAQGRVSQTLDHRHNATQSVYDVLGRRVMTIANYVPQGDPATDPADWEWSAAHTRWEDGADNAIGFGTNNDQNRISTTAYDLAGRVARTRDAAGIETRYDYDMLGRRTQITINYVDGSFNASFPDEDLISATSYNKGSQVVSTTDVRGTQTAFAYDQAGRRLTVTQAADSPLSSVSYTCYDKAGRALRSIQNWIDDGISPDAKTGADWDFVPADNGPYEDRNLVTLFDYDLASRRTQVTDPLGNFTGTAYFKDGQVQSMTDPEAVITQYRYDGLRRRTRVVQSFVDNGEDPALWVWDGTTDHRWEKSGGTAIAHGTNNDQNIIVDVAYDKGSRVLTQRNPRGNVTSYDYDLLNRRLALTNPISQTWESAYSDLDTGGTRATVTYPGVTGAADYTVQRDFDALGRLLSMSYGDPASTPDVRFAYDKAGNRSTLSEYNGSDFTDLIRETAFAYDDVRRLTSVDFDTDGDSSVDESVSYEYDAGGLRTRLTLPSSLEVVYTYDQRGQLVSLTDWDDQKTQFAYDLARRHIATERANGFRSRYRYDAAGRLKRLRHAQSSKTFAHFEYQMDKRGNRTQALELLANPATSSDTTIAYNDKGLLLSGSWAAVSGFQESTQPTAALKLMFLGDEATLTIGTGPDHSIYDVYIGGSLWQSFDGYAASADERDIIIPTDVDSGKLHGEGPHLLEIRNRNEKNANSSDYKVRFKQVVVTDRTWDLQSVEYLYDDLARLLEARYNPGINTTAGDSDLLRRHLFTYDPAGNRLSQSVALSGGMPTTTSYDYNEANQISTSGFVYDNNGNLTSDGTNSYTWDRANRLLSMGDQSYLYDGLGNRIQQKTDDLATKYLLDLQPGLSVVLRAQDWDETDSEDPVMTNAVSYVHSPRGIHAQNDLSGWEWMVQDGLGSVRGVVDDSLAVLQSQNFDPYGTLFGATGSSQTPFGFTGEPTDANGLSYLRARYYTPQLGVFTALDPFEGISDWAMGLNGYSWVEGNVPNSTDPNGKCPQNPWWNDIPGQRCVWLANELSRQYNLPLSVLMQKDWFELEQLYAVGNLNNTLTDASILPKLFSQNGQLALQALGQYVCNNGHGNFLAGLFTTTWQLGLGVLERTPGIGLLFPEGELVEGVIWFGLQIQNAIELRKKRAEIAQADEEALQRDRGNPFDIAFGLSNYSGVFSPPWGDLTAFAASFTDRRTYAFLNWPDWLIRIQDTNDPNYGIGIYRLTRMGVELFEKALPFIVRYYVANIPEGKIKFNLSGMDNRSPDDSITRWELELMLREFRTYTKFYMFNPRTAEKREVVEPELTLELSRIRTAS